MGVPLADVERVAVGRGAGDAAGISLPPPAPPTFSMTIGWPSEVRMRSTKMRPTASVEPPAGNGTISVIGRDG